ncbi:MAG: DUF4416 family protein [Spirochaetaceae bacterium]|nr:DUF4416 family protein [Spirochaetaceae bacterium]
MGYPLDFVPELLVLGLLYSPQAKGEEALVESLERSFGPIRRRGPSFPFPWSGYYDEEMGGRPRRSFLSFERLLDPSTLAQIKLATNDIEASFSESGSRRFNIDPGLLSLGRFVLATTKDRPHRIPLGQGIYGELTLIFENGEYRALPWTYPDWASEEHRSLLAAYREDLKLGLRSLKREVGSGA